MRIALTLVTASLVSPLAAQIGTSTPAATGSPTAAAFANYGTGCTSSGWSYGADIIVPAAQAVAFGNSNNNIPFSWSPTRYQQPFSGTEIGAPVPLVAMSLRQDDGFQNYDGHKIDLAIWLGGTSYPVNGITSNFDANFNSTTAAKTLVFKRRFYALPKMPPALPTNPAVFFITFPFDAPYIPTLGSGENMLMEAINYGNTNGNQIFTYPLDAGSGINTTRLYGFPDTAVSGTLGANYGHIVAFKPIGGAVPPVPAIVNSNLPVIGANFHFEVLGGALNAPGALFIGVSNTTAGGLPLPFDLTFVGAPGCSLLASTEVSIPAFLNAGGDLAWSFAIPNNPALSGGSAFVQFAHKDSAIALGIVLSNAGRLTF